MLAIIGLVVNVVGFGLVLRVGRNLARRIDIMADKFDPLIAQLNELTDTVASAETAFATLADQIEEARDDPEQIDAIVSGLREQKDKLAAAVSNATGEAPEEPAEEA